MTSGSVCCAWPGQLQQSQSQQSVECRCIEIRVKGVQKAMVWVVMEQLNLVQDSAECPRQPSRFHPIKRNHQNVIILCEALQEKHCGFVACGAGHMSQAHTLGRRSF